MNHPQSSFARSLRLGPDHIGTWPATYQLRPHGRSKYMPHIGAKERGRYAS